MAIEYCVQAIHMQPSVAELHHNLTLVHQSPGCHAEAITYLNHERRHTPHPSPPRAFWQRCNISLPASYVRETFDN
jgi:hypothetical protein